jgi:hypothetical protein
MGEAGRHCEAEGMSTTVGDLRHELRHYRNQVTWAGNDRVAAGSREFLALLDAAPDADQVVGGLNVHFADGSWLEWDYDEMGEFTLWTWRRPQKRGVQPMNVLALPEFLDIDRANLPETVAAEVAEVTEQRKREAAEQAAIVDLMELVRSECAFCGAPGSDGSYGKGGYVLSSYGHDRICESCAEGLSSRADGGLLDLSRLVDLPLPVEPPAAIELPFPAKTEVVGGRRVPATPMPLEMWLSRLPAEVNHLPVVCQWCGESPQDLWPSNLYWSGYSAICSSCARRIGSTVGSAT